MAIAPYCITCRYQEEFDPIVFVAALQTVVLNLLLLSSLLGLDPEKSQDFLYLLQGPDILLPRTDGLAFFRVKAKHLYNCPRAPI